MNLFKEYKENIFIKNRNKNTWCFVFNMAKLKFSKSWNKLQKTTTGKEMRKKTKEIKLKKEGDVVWCNTN